jgi:parallel beta-helix repeat protein
MCINRPLWIALLAVTTCVSTIGQIAPPKIHVIPNTSSRVFDQLRVPALSVPDAISPGITYYVDGTKGSDSYNGLYPNHTNAANGPFKTITKATDRYSYRMKGGNVFKIRAGTYHEQISLGNETNVDASHRIVIGPYGDGEVIIDQSKTQSLTWTAYNQNIYVASNALKIAGNSVPPAAIILDDNFRACRPVYALSDVTSYGRWYYDSLAQLIYLYTGGSTPVSRNVYVVALDESSAEFGLFVTTAYTTIYGVTLVGASSYGIYSIANGVTIDWCTIKYAGKGAVSIATNGTSQLTHSHMHGNVLMNWPRGHRWGYNGGWPGAIGMAGVAGGLFSGNIVHDNGGEGFIISGTGSATIEDNIAYNNWSVNLYIANAGNCIMRRNLSYATAPQDTSDLLSSDDPTISWMGDSYSAIYGKSWRRLYPVCISTAVESGDPNNYAQNNKIYNNLVINCYQGIQNDPETSTAGANNVLIANNTVIMPSIAPPTGYNWTGINIPYAGGRNINSFVLNNIVYGTRSSTDSLMVTLEGGATEQGVTFDNNIYYNPNYTTVFKGNNQNYTFAQWKAVLTRQDQHSLFSNPLFAGGSNNLSPSYYVPSVSGPAKGLAQTLSDFLNDFNLVIRTIPWDAGALIAK